jgi:methanogenic corrinoid protein MtbC1
MHVIIMTSKEELKQAIIELKYTDIAEIVQRVLKSGIKPLKALDALKQGLDVVGDLYHNKEYFLSELFMAGETMTAAMEVLMPALSKSQDFEPSEGTIVVGSIRGDVHDFGKNIAKIFLIASGFTVRDLGVDVVPSKFVDEAISMNADIIGISAILSTTQPTSKEVVDLLESRGIRSQFKVILGGTGVTDRAITEYGVDAAVNDASEGVDIIKAWLEGDKQNSGSIHG